MLHRLHPTLTATHLPRLPPLDGLRALAVAAVLAFHTGASWAVGGFLGVDLFFVLSGFLISGLLVAEWYGGDRDAASLRVVRGSPTSDASAGGRRLHRVSLRRFYARRALRLLPAVFLLCAVLLIIGPVASGVDARNALWKGVAGTVFYFANWQQAFELLPPFQLTDHTWSLAIEEQFYLAWPPILLITLTWARRRRVDPVTAAIAVALSLAAASALLRMALWHGPASENRLYYGTDTRADSLLIGAALGISYVTGRLGWARRALPALATPAIVTILVLFGFLHRQDSALYLGGLTVFAVLVAIVIGGMALDPAGPLGRLLALPPLVAIGRISYGIYLWHWPIFRYLHPAELGLGWEATQLVRVAVTLGVATASYLVLERPLLRLRHRFDPPKEKDPAMERQR